MTKFGFTGTRELPTRAALESFALKLCDLADEAFTEAEGINDGIARRVEWHYGMCVGADMLAAELADSAGFWLVGHPPTNRKLIALRPKPHDQMPPLPYLERNKAIVQNAQALIAMPRTTDEELRSGTWSTIRYARRIKRPVLIVRPDGSLFYERWLEKGRRLDD